VVGGPAKAVILTESVAPRLLDALLSRIGYGLHYTKEPKPEGAPDNLYEPLAGNDSAEGTIGGHALSRSLYTRWRLTAPVRAATGIARNTAMRPSGPGDRALSLEGRWPHGQCLIGVKGGIPPLTAPHKRDFSQVRCPSQDLSRPPQGHGHPCERDPGRSCRRGSGASMTDSGTAAMMFHCGRRATTGCGRVGSM
jgi:hypothetical protein